MLWQFFWNLVLVGAVVLIATRVGVALDRDQQLSRAWKWTILVCLVLAVSAFLSLLRLAGP
jgi:NADH:ubiquinone oxidoreductase subunit 6 (subunit J)